MCVLSVSAFVSDSFPVSLCSYLVYMDVKYSLIDDTITVRSGKRHDKYDFLNVPYVFTAAELSHVHLPFL